jgi:predicted RNA binding protein YcfA (HicA-like mRNA interferase family)
LDGGVQAPVELLSLESVSEGVDPRKLARRFDRGALANVRFADFQRFVEAHGFRLRRVTGSHHVFAHPQVAELVNLQNVGGEAKPFQVRQVLRLIERYNLRLETKR